MAAEKQRGQIVPIKDITREQLLDFECGVTAFDRWLKEEAYNAVSRGECAVHVCLDEKNSPIAFFTLSATSISPANTPNKLRGGLSGLIPATLLGKMGVRTDLQGNGYGTHVLHQAMLYALHSAQYVSSRLLVIDALTADLVPWYEERGFIKLPGNERRLVCKMSAIEKICNH